MKILTRDERFMQIATTLAKSHDPGKGILKKSKLCAILVSGNRIISIGFNSDKTHPMAARFAKHEDAVFRHAEVDAILRGMKELRNMSANELRKLTLYVGRTKGLNDDWGLAKPCSGCLRAIKHFGITRVVFSSDNKLEFGELNSV